LSRLTALTIDLGTALGVAGGACGVGAHAAVQGTDRRVVVRGDVVDPHRGSRPVGRETAGLHDHDPHAERRGLGREDPTETVDGELGRLVAGDARGSPNPPADRGELHDDATALLAQVRYDRLRHVVHAPEVGLELGLEVVLVAGLDRGDVRVAGVVDHDIEAAEALHRSADRGAHGAGVGYVEGERQYLAAVIPGEVAELLGAARRGDDSIACLKRRLDEGTAEAVDVIATATSLAGALWQMSTPGPEVLELYRSDPRLGHAVVEVGPRLTRVLTAMLTGLGR